MDELIYRIESTTPNGKTVQEFGDKDEIIDIYIKWGENLHTNIRLFLGSEEISIESFF